MIYLASLIALLFIILAAISTSPLSLIFHLIAALACVYNAFAGISNPFRWPKNKYEMWLGVWMTGFVLNIGGIIFKMMTYNQ